MKVLILAVLLHACLFHKSVRSDVINNGSNIICNQIHNKDKVLNLNIRGALLFKTTLYLITFDWYVYKVPNANFEDSYGKMLFNVSSIPIEKMWSAFAHSRRFRYLKSRIANIYSIGKKIPVIYFDAYNMFGLKYNLDDRILNRGIKYYYDYAKPDAAITSVDEFFSIQYRVYWDKEWLMLIKWEVIYQHSGYIQWAYRDEFYFMYYLRDLNNNKTLQVAITKNILKHKDFPSYISFEPITDWNTPPGFIHRGYFHFFDKSKIYIFSGQNRDYSSRNIFIRADLKVIDAKDFFICDQDKPVPITYPPITTRKDATDWFGNITFNSSLMVTEHAIYIFGNFTEGKIPLDTKAATIMVAILVVMVGLFMLFMYKDGPVQKRKRKKKHKKHSSSPKTTAEKERKNSKQSLKNSRSSLKTVKNSTKKV